VPAVARPLRSDLPDGIYHVTTRGVDGAAIVRSDDDRQIFVARLFEVVGRFRWRWHAFCLMDTHYHLVVETTRVALSAGVRRLNGVYAQGFNGRHGRSGHLFGDRFAARLIESERYLAAACWYVVCNPVRAGCCREPGEWQWSATRFAFGR
jgi:putative transposase